MALSQVDLNNDAENSDFLGRVFFKLHYLKIDFFSALSSVINNTVWKLKGVKLGSGIKYYGFSKVCRHPKSTISIGGNCGFRSDKFSNLIGVNRRCILSTHSSGASIRIGSGCGFSGVSIGCAESITIGNNVLVGANVVITDFDWHNVDPLRRRDPCTSLKPVIIEDNVFIGLNSIVWKGVTIGKNSVIGANSVVTKSIPENCIAAGNPARVIKSI
jgi:acetyltransferase-like isoleucine patch superfamily enzyme